MYLSTDPTSVWLDPGVQAHVSCEHVAAGKAPFADITVVGFPGLATATRLVSRRHVLR